jgi:hypothetical protein
MEKGMQKHEDNGHPAMRRVLDALVPALVERLAEALEPEVVGELAKHIANGKADEIADWAVGGCARALDLAADRLGWPESVSWEGRCARCNGLGRFGIAQVSRCASVQWEEMPSECPDPDACGWPHIVAPS